MHFFKTKCAFSVFFSRFPSSFLMGFWMAFKRCLITVWKPLFSTCCKHKKDLFCSENNWQNILVSHIFFVPLYSKSRPLLCFVLFMLHPFGTAKVRSFRRSAFGLLHLVCSCLRKPKQMSLQLCNHYVFVGCKIIYAAVLHILLRAFQQLASKALVYPVAKLYYLAFAWCEQNVFCVVQQCENVQIVFQLPICISFICAVFRLQIWRVK